MIPRTRDALFKAMKERLPDEPDDHLMLFVRQRLAGLQRSTPVTEVSEHSLFSWVSDYRRQHRIIRPRKRRKPLSE